MKIAMSKNLIIKNINAFEEICNIVSTTIGSDYPDVVKMVNTIRFSEMTDLNKKLDELKKTLETECGNGMIAMFITATSVEVIISDEFVGDVLGLCLKATSCLAKIYTKHKIAITLAITAIKKIVDPALNEIKKIVEPFMGGEGADDISFEISDELETEVKNFGDKWSK